MNTLFSPRSASPPPSRYVWAGVELSDGRGGMLGVAGLVPTSAALSFTALMQQVRRVVDDTYSPVCVFIRHPNDNDDTLPPHLRKGRVLSFEWRGDERRRGKRVTDLAK